MNEKHKITLQNSFYGNLCLKLACHRGGGRIDGRKYGRCGGYGGYGGYGGGIGQCANGYLIIIIG